MSRFYQVVAVEGDDRMVARNTSGQECSLSLLAWSDELPQRGDWIVAHSGYALNRVDRAEAEVAVAEWREAMAMTEKQDR